MMRSIYQGLFPGAFDNRIQTTKDGGRLADSAPTKSATANASSSRRSDTIEPVEASLDQLADLRRWVAWRYEKRTLKNGEEVTTKVPYDPCTGRLAESDNPATWGTRQQAEACRLKGKVGIGIMFGPLSGEPERYLGGIDLDTCRDKSGKVEPAAQAVIDRFKTYAEVSPTGTGVKLYFFFTDLPAIQKAMGTKYGRAFKRGSGKRHPPAIELHVGHRYFAVTDNCHDPLRAVREVPKEDLLWLLNEAGPAFAGKPGKRSVDGSAQLFKLARTVRSRGGTREEYEAAIPGSGEAERHVKDQRDQQRAIDRAWEAADDPKFAHDVADAFRDKYAGQLLYCKAKRQWFAWDGVYWRPDRVDRAFNYAAEECRREGGSDLSRAKSRAQAAAAVEKLARADPAFAVEADHFDRDPFLLGTPSGTVDLRTGELRPAGREDYITKLTAVGPIPLDKFNPDLDGPRWIEFLDQASGGDAGMVRLTQQWFGYCLTGDVREEKITFFQGTGGSGKDTLLGAVTNVMGDYSINVPVGVLTERRYEQHPTEIARLHGARLAWSSETEQDKYWNLQRVKEWTGGGKLSGRFMREDFFEFVPTHKLTVIGNEKLRIRNVDKAVRRRFVVVPFNNPPKKPDETLKAQLRNEYPGILSWLILGCVDWYHNGFILPKSVSEYTSDYLAQQDIFTRWLDECCERRGDYSEGSKRLWESFKQFALEKGENPGTENYTFRAQLSEHDFSESEHLGPKRTMRGWMGLKLRSEFEE